MSRARAYVFGWAVIAAVAYPVTFDRNQDSYPLSSYPMFSARRDRPTVYFAQALNAQGVAQRVPPELVAGPEVMQAAVTIRRAIQGGRRSMRALCRTIAARVGDDPDFEGARHVQLMSVEIDPVAYFVEGPEARTSKPHFVCSVKART